MTNALVWLVATVITVPFIGWYLVYIVVVKWTKNKRRSVRLASDFSTLLFMLGVYFILKSMWTNMSIWIILAVFFLIAMFFTYMHYKVAEDIYIRKLARGIWRLNFLFFFILYFLLSGVGLVVNIMKFY
ncbi:DUF3397 domain-containing protein [Halalkalibacterium halodurans]|uniref:DUF3397 domain-containing protein n=1 Tax=Halalkalibacterium halodurans TaxID=86665 RepID=A0A0M0KJR6_ALKHA|nr:DUF3397 domain-containing protein [Halalkalibacterium halodurans]MED3646119.1 DUF3397 domain-containing protein [Halalkalibacterium halodurans]MED4164170.1 DUF3397 domain-containing protein [Halalkalibacterium halodurans]TES53860.1 DUF3397 domain-containing protein [Halalkalibacterium halodurans]TPE69172.1 DUF3397 domain-containing protein [Halalkalibacterium halodurans]